jgi:hypothetical protein
VLFKLPWAKAKLGAATANAPITTKDLNILPAPPGGANIESALWRFWQSAGLVLGKFSPTPAFADSKDQPECVGDSRFFRNAARI